MTMLLNERGRNCLDPLTLGVVVEEGDYVLLNHKGEMLERLEGAVGDALNRFNDWGLRFTYYRDGHPRAGLAFSLREWPAAKFCAEA